jgi:hypothetical protein
MVRLDGDKAYWREIEEWVCEREDWEDVHKPTHDAVTENHDTTEIKSVSLSHMKVQIWGHQEDRCDYIAIVAHTDGLLHEYLVFESDMLINIESNTRIIRRNLRAFVMEVYDYDDISKRVSDNGRYEVLRNELL